ncbi:MAG: hypothetical protein ABJA81_01690 [Nocardioidaceae bacterium]
MTDDRDDLNIDLKAVFEHYADDAPRVDLAPGALKQARHIRMRRQIAVGGAALAVAAVVVPVGASLIGDSDNQSTIASTTNRETNTGTPTDQTPETSTSQAIDVSLPDLRRGDDPSVPYVGDGQFVEAGQAVSIPSDQPVVDATRLAEGPVIWRYSRGGPVLNYDTAGQTTSLPRGRSASNPAIDSDGSAAWSVASVDVDGQPADTETLLYTDSLTSDVKYAYSAPLSVGQLLAAHEGMVVFNARRVDGSQVVGRVDMTASSPAPVEQPWPNLVSLTAASPKAGLMAGRTTDMTGPQRHCAAMLSYDDASELWRTCNWTPLEFSSDGSRVYAIAKSTEGFGPRLAAVLDADSGQVLQELTTPGTFGRATFEGADTLDIVTVQDDKAAIVRCPSDGNCELATDPLPAVPDSLVEPYQITANP